MAKSPVKKKEYKKLDTEMLKEIADWVTDRFREEEENALRVRRDRKRANIKLLLHKYRDIAEHVDKAVYEASQVDNDLELQDLLELMSSKRRDSFRLESMRENVAQLRLLVDHMNQMLESYRLSCERSHRVEDRRRYRVLYDMYISPNAKTPDEIAQNEHIDKSTVYRDIDAAAERLTVLFFGIYGLKFF